MDLAHHEVFPAKVGKGGIKINNFISVALVQECSVMTRAVFSI